MNSFFNQLKYRFAQFMSGRHGVDQMGQDMSRLVMILLVGNLVLSLILGGNPVSRILYYIALILLIWSYFRIFSKNLEKRYRENQKYLQWKYRTFGSSHKGFNYMRKTIGHWKQRKTHVFFSCPSCRLKMRTPRGQGLKTVTCPRCSTVFTKKT